ncbi:MAG TPA: tetratricopeptide repeat protein [Sphingomicrobium sp.]|nr:tetratricopeptide repeat protein [Sphingomicrobium sp.]
MTRPTLALGAALLLSTAMAGTAAAQQTYGATPAEKASNKQSKKKQGQATMTVAGKQVKVSAEFVAAYQDLQAAVTAGDKAAFSAKLAAAQAIATTPEERFGIAGLQLDGSLKLNDSAGVATALETMLASGILPAAEVTNATLNMGKAYYNAKQYDRAAAAFEKVLQADAGNSDAVSMLAMTRRAQGRGSEGLSALQQLIGQAKSAGQKVPEDTYKRAVQLAYSSKSAATIDLTRQWVQDYPSPANWSDALRIYRAMAPMDEAGTLDVLRLARTAGALKGSDYDRYAFAALVRGYPGEAKAVLEEGFAANAISRDTKEVQQSLSEATAKSAGEQGKLAQMAKDALAAPGAKQAVATGDVLYGYGEYAKAAELYRAALGKPGVDANLANLHLGMALARAGDKAGATAALNAVAGPRAALARFWLAWLASRP